MIESVRSTPPPGQGRPWFFEVLPCHPPPYPGECWSGYLLRLAEINGVTIGDLARDLFPHYRGPHAGLSRLSWEYPVDHWARVPLRTQLSLAELKRLTVVPWLEKFRPLPTLDRGTGGPGRFLQGMVSPHWQVCPRCLEAQPYLPLLWRLVPVRACLQHRCWLETECPQCERPLAVLKLSSRHLRCAHCGTDVRSFPVRSAPADLLVEQAQRQADLQFLLDPAVSLVKMSNPENEAAAFDPSAAIGLKLCYLRGRAGRSLEELAPRVGVQATHLSSVERGEHASPLLYLAYLEALGSSWPAFAALEVPHSFVEHLHAIPFLSLRLCPSPDCSNHAPPPSMRVKVSADLPDRRTVRFRCETCGRTFTRSYEGALVTKPRRPVIRPGEPPTVPKSDGEIARLTGLGLRGRDNREIAQQLGWGEKTVRMYWIALGLEEQVHRAQAERRLQEQTERHAAVRTRVAAVLNELLDQDEEITVRQVGRVLGFNPDYLQSFPDVMQEIRAVAPAHNARVRQHEQDRLLKQLAPVIEALQHSDRRVTMQGLAQQAGLSLDMLWRRHPKLYAIVREAVQKQRARLRETRVATRCAEVNAAAARLAARGTRLTYRAICREAGLKEYLAYHDPAVLALLRQWIGDFAPGD